MLTALADHDVDGEVVRVADHDVRFGVSTDEGDGDEWPALRRKLLDAHILVMATPIWLGQPSSVCKMVLERLLLRLCEYAARAAPAPSRQPSGQAGRVPRRIVSNVRTIKKGS